MYGGRILEVAATETLFDAPSHPYTQLLLASVPDSGMAHGRPTRNSPPADTDPTGACIFAERCPLARADCWSTRPALQEHPGVGMVACHYAAEASELWQSRKTGT
jgi:oligopeptide/dipeptide ABC transporter ATP-binding protein